MNTVQLVAQVHDGERFERLKTATDEILLRVTSGGNVQVVEYTSDDRDGAPAHRHEWDEIEIVLDGTAEFLVGGEWIAGGPGTVQTLPAGASHSVRIPSGKARLLMITIGRPYDAFARELATLGDAPAVDALVAAAARHGVRLGDGV